MLTVWMKLGYLNHDTEFKEKNLLRSFGEISEMKFKLHSY